MVVSVLVVVVGTLLFNRFFGTDAMLRNAAVTENELPEDVEVAALLAVTSTGEVGRIRAARDSTDVGKMEAIPVEDVVEGMRGGDVAR